MHEHYWSLSDGQRYALSDLARRLAAIEDWPREALGDVMAAIETEPAKFLTEDLDHYSTEVERAAGLEYPHCCARCVYVAANWYGVSPACIAARALPDSGHACLARLHEPNWCRLYEGDNMAEGRDPVPAGKPRSGRP